VAQGIGAIGVVGTRRRVFVFVVPLLVAMVFMQRFLRTGLAQGSVKG
jgi:hypothetical protein